MHYVRLRLGTSKRPTFDQIKQENYHMSLAEYLRFSKEFQLGVNRHKVVEIFKKLAAFSQSMYYNEFKDSLVALERENLASQQVTLIKELNEVKALRKQLDLNKAEDNESREILTQKVRSLQDKHQQLK